LKSSKAGLIVVTAACLVLALLTVFAVELSNTQANSKRGIEVQVHERAVLAGALISSLFQTVQQQVPQDSKIYGSAVVSDKTLNAPGQQSGYVAVLDRSGTVLASSRSFTAQARAELAGSAALALIRAGRPYGLGNVAPYGSTGVIDFAIAFPTPYGNRILVTGFTPGALSVLMTRALDSIPGVKGSHNYLVDGNDVVLASTNPAAQVGHLIPGAGAVQVLERHSGDVRNRYFDQVELTNSTWRIVLAAPDGPLFASVTGLHQLVPWLIFAAFALVALAALALGWRVLRASDQLHEVNRQLEGVNDELIGANETLERRAMELARSNQELDQFASIASHDLQEPLRKVQMFTEQLTVMERDHLSDKGHDYLRRTNAAAQRMQTLIEDLLRFSRVATEGRPFAPVDLDQITRQVLDDLDALVADSRAIVHLAPLPTVNADALQMQQLMQNLISNALKFHREGVPPEVTIGSTVAEETAQLTVSDNGIGFDLRYSQRIFRIFERLHPRNKYPGTGIGLALCRKIVERHGGYIVASSELDAGSTFTVTLPLHLVDEVIVLPRDLGAEVIDDTEVDEGAQTAEGAHVNA
jgi:signal transduction histidine kinase